MDDDHGPAADVLTAPSDPRGPALSAFALQVRRAVQGGQTEIVVDESACRTWSPGQLLVLDRLRHLAESCGRRWRSLDTARHLEAVR